MYSVEIRDQRTTIARLENERDFYSLESTKLGQQVAFQITELKKLDYAILQYKKKLGGLETQLKKTQQTYDLAIYDKSVFERTLSDTLVRSFPAFSSIFNLFVVVLYVFKNIWRELQTFIFYVILDFVQTEILENMTKIKHLKNQISALKNLVTWKDNFIHEEALSKNNLQTISKFES